MIIYKFFEISVVVTNLFANELFLGGLDNYAGMSVIHSTVKFFAIAQQSANISAHLSVISKFYTPLISAFSLKHTSLLR